MGYTAFAESVVEDAALAWLEALGYSIRHGPDIAVSGRLAERADPDYKDVVLEQRLRQAVARLNPDLPLDAQADAVRRVTSIPALTLIERNRAVHRLLVDGVAVELRRPDGSIGGAIARLLDFTDPDANDWMAANQFTVVEAGHERRPDIVLFVNGLPLGVIELRRERVDVGAPGAARGRL
jgi:type I restriction enzyme R subunit